MNKEKFLNRLYRLYGKMGVIKDFELFCKLPQADKVWWHLNTFGSITNKLCHEIYGIRHCPSVIRDLRNNPFTYGNYKVVIDSVEEKDKDRWGNKTDFVIYTLKEVA